MARGTFCRTTLAYYNPNPGQCVRRGGNSISLGEGTNRSTRACHVKTRGPWQGMMTIARFNWPFYLAVLAVLISALAGLFLLGGTLPRIACVVTSCAAAYF